MGATAGEGTRSDTAPSSAAGIQLYTWTPSTTSIEATSIGAISVASKSRSTAVGYLAQALAPNSLVVGSSSTAEGSKSIVLGVASSTAATATKAVAIGVDSDVSGVGSVAVGNDVDVTGNRSVALGGISAAGVRTNAAGDEAVSLGAGAQASLLKSVAIGSDAKTTRALGSVGYVPNGTTGNSSLDKTTSTWTSTHAAVAVGDDTGTTYDPVTGITTGAAKVTRQITGVAAGSRDTDAVNVAQLKKLAAGEITFAGDSGTAFGRKLGETANVKGGATGTLTDNNIGVVANGTDTLTVKLAQAIDLGAAGSVTMGATQVNNSGLTITGGPSVTSAGIDAASKPITNVASGGTTDTNAANIGDVKKAAAASKTTVTQGDNIVVTPTTNADGSTTYEVATAKNLVVHSVKAGNTTLNDSGVTIVGGANGTVSLTNAGLNNGGNKITNVAAGTSDTDAVNVAQLNEVKATAAQKATVSAANDSVKVTATTNSTGGTDYAVGLADKVTVGSNAGTAVTIDGTNGSVTAGSVTVNGAAGTIGGLSNKTFDAKNFVTGQAATEDQLAQVVNNLSTIASQHTTVKAGKNTVVAEGTNATGGKEYTVSVADDLTLNSATFTDTAGNSTVVNAAGSTVSDSSGNKTTTSAAGVTVTNGSSTVSMTANGLDNGGNKITNVAAGTADTDAVNVGQVNAALNTVNQSINNLGNKISEVGKESKAGSASAIATANLPQATIPGMGMTTVGLGTYDGQSAIAVGLSKMSDNGKWVIKASATTNTQGKVGAGVGVGFHW